MKAFLWVLLVAIGSTLCAPAAAYEPVAPPPPGKPINGRVLGELARRVIQTGYFLEILTSQMCRAYVREPHSAAADVSFVVDTLPDEIKRQKGVVETITEHNEEVKSYAQREISEASRNLSKSTEALRCGYLLGVASVTYYQAKRDWDFYLRLERPAPNHPFGWSPRVP